MNYANKNNIEELLKTDITSYRIAKDTGISEVSVNKYRKDDVVLENMTLGTAIKFQRYYEYLKEKNELDEISREEAFGRAIGVLSILSQRLYEKNKPPIHISKEFHDYANKPSTIHFMLYKDIMSYSHKFNDDDRELLDRVNRYISELDASNFNDEPLGPSYLIYSSKEIVALEHYVEGEL